MSVLLRPAQPTDAGKTAAILGGFIDEADWMPRLHSRAQDIGFCGHMIDRGWVTVALQDGHVAGFIARDGEEVSCLYVAGVARGQGLGRRLLGDAKAHCASLRLWTFAANSNAIRFYHREGFAEVGQGDGTDTEEGLPDIRFVWKKGQPT